MSNQGPVALNPQEELRNLYAEKGELVHQLEIGQGRLMMINQRLNQILGIQAQTPR